ncbi:MAG TPA: bifunctional shikimate kinase/3-dehydroquinate synthase [Candidatus Polarisedimenticolia bacterium]|nr:bifunctional shikimate kinase/3-dehydroquinate synthase [Candidatus Polarisedimenticolia bacterium]
MDVVLVGLPGSGKTAVGKRLATRHGATFVDLDERIEHEAGARIPQIFEAEGEAGFRARERTAIADLGPGDSGPVVRRIIAPGGGAIVDPRNRWQLYRGRTVIWLDGRPEVLAQRLRRSPNVRPLVQGRDPIGTLRELSEARGRFYAAGRRVRGVAELQSVVDAVDAEVAAAAREGDAAHGTTLLAAETRIGRIVIGDGIAATSLMAALQALEARRALIVTEPGAWAAVGADIEAALAAAGLPIERGDFPPGEAAKSMRVIEAAARELARMHVERGEPIVAIGGGALGDAAGFLAATYLRGLPLIHVPTTLVAQVDSSIGGKTAVDLPEGKNLVGAFHQPVAVIIDVRLLRDLPERELRAALGEVVKMAALGDERLFELLEADGAAIARGDAQAFERGAVAEAVERAAWAKVETVLADEREADRRISLNLGHSIGHAVEAAAEYRDLRHGEAVAVGLRGACRIGVAMTETPPERAARIERLLDALGLARDPLPLSADAVLQALSADKKHAAGRMRWVLPTADGWTVRDNVPDELVASTVAGLLLPAAAATGARA